MPWLKIWLLPMWVSTTIKILVPRESQTGPRPVVQQDIQQKTYI